MVLPVFLLLFCCHRFRQCLDYTGWCFQYFCFFSAVTVFINAWIILVDASSIFASFSAVTVFINVWIILVDASSIFASFLLSPFSSMLGLYWLMLPVFLLLFCCHRFRRCLDYTGWCFQYFCFFSAVTVFVNAWIILVGASSIFASFLLSPFSSMLGLYWLMLPVFLLLSLPSPFSSMFGLYWLMLPVFLLLFCCHRFHQCLDYTGWCFQYFCFFSAVTVFVNAWIILVGASSIFASFLLSPFSSMLGLYWLMLPVFLLLFCRQFSSMLGL